MITAIDTSVLLDVFLADPHFGPSSRETLRGCLSDGRIVACDIVWSEIAGVFPRPADAREQMDLLGIGYDAMAVDSALAAGAAWQAYRARGGSRWRMVADFLVGAHAARQADRLLTRDRGFYRTYFRRLTILEPGRPRRP